MAFSFRCATCGEIHEGMPTFGAAAPLSYYAIPKGERAARCSLGTDDCVIDEQHFLVRGNLEIHVHGEEDRFAWGVWVSLSRTNFEEWIVHLGDHGIRPYIELEPTDHPLALEQRDGITRERVAEIYSMMIHENRRPR